MSSSDHNRTLATPDGRYIVVRGRLWRRSNPVLDDETRAALVQQLMAARRAIGGGDPAARAQVHAAKVALGERGAVWWTDGAPDWTRHLARNTPYADWHAAHEKDPGPPRDGSGSS